LEDNLDKENKIFERTMKDTNLVGSNLSNVTSNNKISFYNQLPSSIRKDLGSHIWELISYNPIEFIVAHSKNKQILYARLKDKSKKK
jgi:hypothetical protein